jgi:hypothetical protein
MFIQPGYCAPAPALGQTRSQPLGLDGNVLSVISPDMKVITLRDLAREPKYGRLAHNGQSFLVTH